MKKLFGNGRPIAAAVLAVGIAAIAVPAFGASAGGGAKKELEQTAQCMNDHGIDPPEPNAGLGTTPPKLPSPSEFQAAAKACGLPKPPGGALPPPPMAAPGAPGKATAAAIERCIHAQQKNEGSGK